MGISGNVIIAPNFIFDVEGSRKVYPLPDHDLPGQRPDVNQMVELNNDLHGIGWWRIMREPDVELKIEN